MGAAWAANREWEGECAFLLAGGASLSNVDISKLKGKGRVVAINRSFEVSPWADLLFFADWRFYKWYRSGIDAFAGLKVTASHNGDYPADVKRIKWDRRSSYSRDPAAVSGNCSGALALNLTALRGANPIVLVGYDMRGDHWHEDHPEPTNLKKLEKSFKPGIERMAPYLAAAGVEVFNVNSESALRCFPFREIAEFQ